MRRSSSPFPIHDAMKDGIPHAMTTITNNKLSPNQTGKLILPKTEFEVDSQVLSYSDCINSIESFLENDKSIDYFYDSVDSIWYSKFLLNSKMVEMKISLKADQHNFKNITFSLVNIILLEGDLSEFINIFVKLKEKLLNLTPSLKNNGIAAREISLQEVIDYELFKRSIESCFNLSLDKSNSSKLATSKMLCDLSVCNQELLIKTECVEKLSQAIINVIEDANEKQTLEFCANALTNFLKFSPYINKFSNSHVISKLVNESTKMFRENEIYKTAQFNRKCEFIVAILGYSGNNTSRSITPVPIEISKNASTLTFEQLVNKADSHANSGESLEAELTYDEVFEKFSELTLSSQDTSKLYDGASQVYIRNQSYEKATKYLQKLLLANEQKFGFAHPRTILTKIELYKCSVKYAIIDSIELDNLYKSSIAAFQKMYGETHPIVVAQMSVRAKYLKECGHYIESETLYRRIMTISTAEPDTYNQPSFLSDVTELADLMFSSEKFDESEKLYEQSVNISESLFGNDHYRTRLLQSRLNESIQLKEIMEEQEKSRHIAVSLNKDGNYDNDSRIPLRYEEIYLPDNWTLNPKNELPSGKGIEKLYQQPLHTQFEARDYYDPTLKKLDSSPVPMFGRRDSSISTLDTNTPRTNMDSLIDAYWNPDIRAMIDGVLIKRKQEIDNTSSMNQPDPEEIPNSIIQYYVHPSFANPTLLDTIGHNHERNSDKEGNEYDFPAIQARPHRMLGRSATNSVEYEDGGLSSVIPIQLSLNVDEQLKLKRFITRIDDPCKKAIKCLAIFSPYDTKLEPLLVTGSADGALRAWKLLSQSRTDNSEERSFVFSNGTNKEITALAIYSPTLSCIEKGRKPLLVSASDGDAHRRTVVWDLLGGRKLFHLGDDKVGHQKGVMCLTIYDRSKTGESPLLFTAGIDKTVILWDIESRQIIRMFDQGPFVHTDIILSMSVYLPEQKYENHFGIKSDPILLTASWDKTVIYWDINTGKSIHKFCGHTKSVTSLAIFCPTGLHMPANQRSTSPMIITGSLDKTVIAWDLVSGEKIRTFTGHSEKVTSVTTIDCTNDCGPLIVTCSEDKKAIIFDLLTGQIVRKLVFHTDAINAAVVYSHPSLTGLLIVTASKDCSAVVWNFAKKKDRTRTLITPAMVTSVAVFENRRDGEPMVLVATVDDKCVVFMLHTGKKRKDLLGHNNRVNCVVVYEPLDINKTPIAVTGAADKTAIVWNLRTFAQLQVLNGHTDIIFPVAVYHPSPSSKNRPAVITGGRDKIAVVWEMTSTFYDMPEIKDNENCVVFQEKFKLVGHDEFVRAIAVHSPDDPNETPLIITGGYDKIAIVWNANTGHEMFRLECKHESAIFALAVYDPHKFMRGESNSKSELKLLQTDENVDKFNDVSIKKRALIITGGYDGKTMIWDLETGVHKQTLDGHKDSVTALAVYDFPRSATETLPMLITGSIDKTILVWDLNTGKIMDKLVGHTDRLMSIVVFAQEADHPLLITGSDDKSTIVWEDSLYPFELMPLSYSVRRAFDFDLTEEGWPLISELTLKYGAGLFVENSYLFIVAVQQRRPDFLRQFQHMLSYVLRFIPNDVSLLYLATEMKNLECVRIILDCWLENLNTDIHDYLSQRLFHPSYFLNTEKDLTRLAEVYPSEFVKFICCIKLIKSHKSVKSDIIVTYIIKSEYRSLVLACTSPNDVKIWGRKEENDNKGQPVISMYLPVKDAASIRMLRVYQIVSDELEDVDIFNSDLGLYSYRFIWEKHILDVHWKSIRDYVIFLTLFTSSVLTYNQKTLCHIPSISSFSLIFHLFTIASLIYTQGYELSKTYYYIFTTSEDRRQVYKNQIAESLYSFIEDNFSSKEYEQMVKTAQSKKNVHLNSIGSNYESYLKNWSVMLLINHFFDFWNLVDLSIIITALIGISSRLINFDGTWVRVLLAIASILVCFKILYFLRPFQASGPLVSMILQIAKDIRFFLLVLFTVLFGFTLAFWLLHYPFADLDFAHSLFNSFMYMLGQNILFENLSTSIAPLFSTILLVLFMFIMMLLMLNVLIALMNETFTTVREKGLAKWRQEQASIILEQQFLLENEKDDVVIPPYIHVLKYMSDLPSDLDRVERNDETDAKMKVHKQQLLLKEKQAKQNGTLLTMEERILNIDKKANEMSEIVKMTRIKSRKFATNLETGDDADDEEQLNEIIENIVTNKTKILTNKIDSLESKIDQLLSKMNDNNRQILS
eukprot:gene4171-5938_t